MTEPLYIRRLYRDLDDKNIKTYFLDKKKLPPKWECTVRNYLSLVGFHKANVKENIEEWRRY